MPIDPVTATTNASQNAGANQSRGILGKDDFLKLLIGQMQNQDPMNPSDPSQSMDQMTQFSILEQLTNLGATMSATASNDYDAQAVNLIGKRVTYSSDDLRTTLTGTVEGVTFTSSGPELTIDGRSGIPPVALLSVGGEPTAPSGPPADGTDPTDPPAGT